MPTEKQKLRNLKATDFDKRIEVWILKNQGWSFNQIGRKLGKSPQGCQVMYKKVKDMTLDELTDLRNQVVDN